MLDKVDWGEQLKEEFGKPYWAALQAFLDFERSSFRVYPPPDEVFAALLRTSYEDTRAVILGQDPYHGAGQAHGLAFSVPHGVRIPPSLGNIHKELHADVGADIPAHGSLEMWASHQGVLLLNTVLTVCASAAGSHRGRGWESFTDAIIELIARKDGVVFVLWGKQAQKKAALIEPLGRTIIASAHPSPQSARRGFFGSQPFSRVNEARQAARLEPINWSLT